VSALLTGVEDKVRRLLPNGGDRFTDTRLADYIRLADCAIRENAEIEWASTELDLVAGALYYPLPTDVIEVRSVEFSRDGSIYDSTLRPVTIEELDRCSLHWQDDTATEPEFYGLLSQPGIYNWSKLLLWKKMDVVTSETVRVNYVKSRAAAGDLAAVDVPDSVQYEVYVPFVMALCCAEFDVSEAEQRIAIYLANVPKVWSRYQNPYGEDPVRAGLP
jgi:hypothetical protein